MQALAQALQQALQIVQSAGGGGELDQAADDGMEDPSMMDGEQMYDDEMPDDGMEDPSMMGDDMADDGMMEDPSMMGDDDQLTPDMGDDGGMTGNLDDRVAQLEQHTGLKKSATVHLTLDERLDQLEEIHLGQAYEGPDLDRIRQLETKAPRLRKALAQQTAAEAPDQIDLQDLIKAAVAEGVKAGRAQAQQEAGLPNLGTLRNVSNRRAQATTVRSEDDLRKSVAGQEDDLDLSEIGFGGALQGLYFMNAANGLPPIDAAGDD